MFMFAIAVIDIYFVFDFLIQTDVLAFEDDKKNAFLYSKFVMASVLLGTFLFSARSGDNIYRSSKRESRSEESTATLLGTFKSRSNLYIESSELGSLPK